VRRKWESCRAGKQTKSSAPRIQLTSSSSDEDGDEDINVVNYEAIVGPALSWASPIFNVHVVDIGLEPLAGNPLHLSDEERFAMAIAESLKNDKDNQIALAHIEHHALEKFGRVIDRTTNATGNCMFDAPVTQMAAHGIGIPEGFNMEILREACAEWGYDSYRHSSPDVLLAGYGHDSWEDWKRNMLQDEHWGDEIMFEALAHVYGGFYVHCVVGTQTGAYLRLHGDSSRPRIFLGLQLDRHVSSLILPARNYASVSAESSLVAGEEEEEKEPTNLTKKRPHFEFVAHQESLPCCGQVHGKDNSHTTHECSLCGRKEHISCSTERTNRRQAWTCSDCR
jgi:hypothetical protein